jgi:hypothetical protein
MAVTLIVEFPGATQDQYDDTIEALGMTPGSNQELPYGMISHVAGPTSSGWIVVDVWESRADFDRFLKERLSQALIQAGLPTPTVREVPVHNMMGLRVPVGLGAR